ncbi:unnamed protein product, partial [marine sediment metagenome]
IVAVFKKLVEVVEIVVAVFKYLGSAIAGALAAVAAVAIFNVATVYEDSRWQHEKKKKQDRATRAVMEWSASLTENTQQMLNTTEALKKAAEEIGKIPAPLTEALAEKVKDYAAQDQSRRQNIFSDPQALYGDDYAHTREQDNVYRQAMVNAWANVNAGFELYLQGMSNELDKFLLILDDHNNGMSGKINEFEQRINRATTFWSDALNTAIIFLNEHLALLQKQNYIAPTPPSKPHIVSSTEVIATALNPYDSDNKTAGDIDPDYVPHV